jgi:hypothetical protein
LTFTGLDEDGKDGSKISSQTTLGALDEHGVEVLGDLDEGGLGVGEFLMGLNVMGYRDDLFSLFDEAQSVVEEADLLGESGSVVVMKQSSVHGAR